MNNPNSGKTRSERLKEIADSNRTAYVSRILTIKELQIQEAENERSQKRERKMSSTKVVEQRIEIGDLNDLKELEDLAGVEPAKKSVSKDLPEDINDQER